MYRRIRAAIVHIIICYYILLLREYLRLYTL